MRVPLSTYARAHLCGVFWGWTVSDALKLSHRLLWTIWCGCWGQTRILCSGPKGCFLTAESSLQPLKSEFWGIFMASAYFLILQTDKLFCGSQSESVFSPWFRWCFGRWLLKRGSYRGIRCLGSSLATLVLVTWLSVVCQFSALGKTPLYLL